MIAAGTVDIWDRLLPPGHTAHQIRNRALLHEIGASSSTQHNNERLVKLGSLAASTNKNDSNVSNYVIASNNFPTEYCEPGKTREVDDAGQLNEIKRRDRGNFQGKKKLLDFVRVAIQKHDSIGAYQNKIGDDEYNRIRRETQDNINDHDSSLKEVEADAKVESMMINLEVDKELLAKARKKGVDRPPRILGYYPFRPLGFVQNVLHLENELNKRMVEFSDDMNVTAKCKLLKEHEKQRFECEVDKELRTREIVNASNNTLHKKLQRLNKYAEETEISSGGCFTLDTDKFF